VNFYSFAKGVVRVVWTPFYRYEVIGQENIPKEGGVLLCGNHIHNFDPISIGLTCPRQIHFMAKEEIFRVPVLRTVVKALHGFPVKRGKGDRAALRTGLQILNDGHVLGLFPEGTRNKSGELGQAMAGAGFFALRTDCQVVPCAIIGDYKVFRKMKVVYGNPIDMKPLRERKASAMEVAEIIMAHIKEILLQYK